MIFVITGLVVLPVLTPTPAVRLSPGPLYTSLRVVTFHPSDLFPFDKTQ